MPYKLKQCLIMIVKMIVFTDKGSTTCTQMIYICFDNIHIEVITNS